MPAKPGDILFCEGNNIYYQSPSGGSPSILHTMDNWQGGKPTHAEWNNGDVYIYTERGWIYKMRNAIGSPDIFKSGRFS